MVKSDAVSLSKLSKSKKYSETYLSELKKFKQKINNSNYIFIYPSSTATKSASYFTNNTTPTATLQGINLSKKQFDRILYYNRVNIPCMFCSTQINVQNIAPKNIIQFEMTRNKWSVKCNTCL